MTKEFFIVVATLSSIGTPGIPGGSIVMLMLVLVLSSVGIPAEGLALILGTVPWICSVRW